MNLLHALHLPRHIEELRKRRGPHYGGGSTTPHVDGAPGRSSARSAAAPKLRLFGRTFRREGGDGGQWRGCWGACIIERGTKPIDASYKYLIRTPSTFHPTYRLHAYNPQISCCTTDSKHLTYYLQPPHMNCCVTELLLGVELQQGLWSWNRAASSCSNLHPSQPCDFRTPDPTHQKLLLQGR